MCRDSKLNIDFGLCPLFDAILALERSDVFFVKSRIPLRMASMNSHQFQLKRFDIFLALCVVTDDLDVRCFAQEVLVTVKQDL